MMTPFPNPGTMEAMDEPKSRRWFQIHYSTVIVMTLVAGILVWTNTVRLLLNQYGLLGWPLSQFKPHLHNAIYILYFIGLLITAGIFCEFIIHIHFRNRTWFQLHLSTALALMLVMGVLVGLNSVPKFTRGTHYSEFESYGWPYGVVIFMKGDPKIKLIREEWAANAAVALAILAATTIACEWWARRSVRKERESKGPKRQKRRVTKGVDSTMEPSPDLSASQTTEAIGSLWDSRYLAH